PAIAAVSALSVNGRDRRHQVEVDVGDRVDGVDQRHRIGAAGLRRLGRLADVGDVWRELDDHGHARVLLAPAGDHLDVFWNLADRRAHAAFTHAVRTAEVEFDTVGFGLLDPLQDR